MEKDKKVITLNIYDDEDKIIKTVEAKMVKIRFGVVRSLMKLVRIENVNNTKELLQMLDPVWEKLERILDKVFPDMEEDDWDGVDTFELIKVIMRIIKSSSKKLDEIPLDGDEKN